MTLTMADSVTPAHLPPGMDYYAAYIDGDFSNAVEVQQRFPTHTILTIAVRAADDADCLDVENGDAVPSEAPAWVSRQHARGIARPVIYSSQSEMPTVLGQLALARIPRSSVRLWTAHYTHEHICSPGACGAQGFVADGTQWAGSPGNSPGPYDLSLLNDNFFTAPGPTPAPVLEDDMPALIQGPSGPQGGTVIVAGPVAWLATGSADVNPYAGCPTFRVPGPQFSAFVTAAAKLKQEIA